MWPITTAGEGMRVEDPLEVADHALSEVEQEGRRAPLDEIARGRGRRVGGGGAAAEHGQAEPIAEDVAHGANARRGASTATACG